MTELGKHNVSDDSGESIYANRKVFGILTELNRTNRTAASVMLTLMARMGADSKVQITQAAVAELCNCTLQQVEKAIDDLAEGNWILSVDASSESGGPLTCIVNTNLARSEKPNDLM